jgi:hypothetical protein
MPRTSRQAERIMLSIAARPGGAAETGLMEGPSRMRPILHNCPRSVRYTLQAGAAYRVIALGLFESEKLRVEIARPDAGRSRHRNRGGEPVATHQIGYRPRRSGRWIAVASKEPGAGIGRDRHSEAVQRPAQAFPGCLDECFLSGPAGIESPRLNPLRKRCEFGLLFRSEAGRNQAETRAKPSILSTFQQPSPAPMSSRNLR